MNYYNKTDAHSAGIGIPHYNNLASYKQYLRGQREKIKQNRTLMIVPPINHKE